MLDWVQPVLGFISASLVALIALFFGVMMLFFSGSAVIVLGQFLPFVRSWRVAAVTIALAVLVTGALALLAGVESPWKPPLSQLVLSVIAWALVAWRASHRFLRWGLGGFFAVSGVIYPLSLIMPRFEGLGYSLVLLVFLTLQLAAVGLWPLALGGLVQHWRERRVEWFISLRYLTAKRRQTFISVITVICALGVALGVAVIMVVLSVMNGFSAVWEGKIIGARAHFVVHSRMGAYPDYMEVRETVLSVPGVEGATPFLATDAILRGERGALQAIALKGVDPATVGEATQLAEDLVEGSLAALDGDPEEGEPPGIIVGAELADRFFLRLEDAVVLISPLGGAPTPLGPAPRMLRFRVVGIFRANFFQFDESFVYTSLGAAQHFMKVDDVVSGVEVRTADPYRSDQIGQEVERALGGMFYARDWKTFYPGFFQALKMERVMMFVLLSFIMVVAGFIIVATLIMMIMEKSRDIAILKAMGCDDDAVLRVFAIQGFLIGTAGLALGLGMGLVITSNLDVIQLVVERITGYDVLPVNVYQLSQLPYDVDPWQVAVISLIAVTLSIGATLLPSWQASQLDPAEALRYD
jgi:lipoprotein-releasing system permease protein